jgi:hypothetical protein
MASITFDYYGYMAASCFGNSIVYLYNSNGISSKLYLQTANAPINAQIDQQGQLVLASETEVYVYSSPKTTCVNGKCYIFLNQATNQTQAAYVCSVFNATLMNLQSRNDVQLAFSLSSNSEIWVIKITLNNKQP